MTGLSKIVAFSRQGKTTSSMLSKYPQSVPDNFCAPSKSQTQIMPRLYMTLLLFPDAMGRRRLVALNAVHFAVLGGDRL
jgi:hypothetical protein